MSTPPEQIHEAMVLLARIVEGDRVTEMVARRDAQLLLARHRKAMVPKTTKQQRSQASATQRERDPLDKARGRPALGKKET